MYLSVSLDMKLDPTINRRSFLGVTAASVAGLAGCTAPEQSQSMSDPGEIIEAMASLPTLAHPTVSPDGSEVALYYDDTGRNELHVMNVETGEREQWSDGEVPRSTHWFIEWDAEGEKVFFHLGEDGNEQNDIYAIDSKGDVSPVVEMEGQSYIADVGSQGERLLVASTAEGQLNLYDHHLGEGETTKLTDYDRAVFTGMYSPDGDKLAYVTNESDNVKNTDVYLAAADGSDPRNLKIGETGAEAQLADWAPDGNRLLVGDNSSGIPRPGIYNIETDEVTWYGGEHEEQPTVFAGDGRRFLSVRTQEATKMPVVYDIETDQSRELDLPEGVVGIGHQGGNRILDQDRVLLTHTTPTSRTELLTYNLTTDKTETLLAPDHGPFESEEFADATYFTFESDGIPKTRQAAVEHDPYDSIEIGGLFFDSGERPSPLVVNPHGGPQVMDDKSFDLRTQFLVQRGYSVVQINYRGSAGRGREFRRELFDDWGGAEQGDIATGVEYVLDEFDWLNENQVAVFGGSFGGYSAYWQLLQYPDLYDAGVAWIAVSDLKRMYEDTMPHLKTELLKKSIGTPSENPDLYRKRSPIEYVENLNAPLFILHGVNDQRVPVSQARLFREALLNNGYKEGSNGDFEYRELGEEGHASSDIDQKKRLFRLLDDFFGRRLKI